MLAVLVVLRSKEAELPTSSTSTGRSRQEQEQDYGVLLPRLRSFLLSGSLSVSLSGLPLSPFLLFSFLAGLYSVCARVASVVSHHLSPFPLSTPLGI